MIIHLPARLPVSRTCRCPSMRASLPPACLPACVVWCTYVDLRVECPGVEVVLGVELARTHQLVPAIHQASQPASQQAAQVKSSVAD